MVLTKEYIYQLHQCPDDIKDKVMFHHFDFHAFCSGDNYHQLKVMLGKLTPGLLQYGFFAEERQPQSKVTQRQTGVFRVNCLDSLDRTNVAQSMIGVTMFQKQLQSLGLADHFGEEANREGLAFADFSHDPLVSALKHFWAEQGDYLSQQNAGTTSTISRVSRDGREGFLGHLSHKIKNVERYFVNTLSENFSQNSIDILLGSHALQGESSSEMRSYLDIEMKKREDLYSLYRTVRIHVGTWNLGGQEISEAIEDWLLPFKAAFLPEVFVLGFQEIVELNPRSVLLGDSVKDRVEALKETVLNTINSQDFIEEEYVHVVSESLVGSLCAVFCKRSLLHRLTDIATSKVKLGFSSSLGNKGATLVRFCLDDTSLVFVNCHLESGTGKAKKRADQVEEVYQNGFIRERGT